MYRKTQNGYVSGMPLIFASKHVNMKRRNVLNMRQRYQILTVICNIDIFLLYDYLQSDVTATMTAQQKLRGNHHAKGNIHSPALIKCHCHVSRNPICNMHMTCPPLTVKGCGRLQKHKTNFTCIICIKLKIGCLYCN